MTNAIKERRPGIEQGSIHCPVQCMKGIIATSNPEAIAGMIRQLRAAYPTAPAYKKANYLWLGRRYQEAYKNITGKPL